MMLTFPDSPFRLAQTFPPAGDQPEAIDRLVEGIRDGLSYQTLLGVTGTLRDAATATATAAGRRLTAHAQAHELVAANGPCGSASAVPHLRALAGPLAVTAC